jgi:hypothetical protein
MSQQNIQNYENVKNNAQGVQDVQDVQDHMTNYLQNQRPTVIIDNDNEPILIGPLNTDIRFNAYNSNSEQRLQSNYNNNRQRNK